MMIKLSGKLFDVTMPDKLVGDGYKVTNDGKLFDVTMPDKLVGDEILVVTELSHTTILLLIRVRLE